eukprot:1026277-Prymnesium_polylepis.1
MGVSQHKHQHTGMKKCDVEGGLTVDEVQGSSHGCQSRQPSMSLTRHLSLSLSWRGCSWQAFVSYLVRTTASSFVSKVGSSFGGPGLSITRLAWHEECAPQSCAYDRYGWGLLVARSMASCAASAGASLRILLRLVGCESF